MNKYLLTGGRILTPGYELEGHDLEITGTKITNIFKKKNTDNNGKKDKNHANPVENKYSETFNLGGKIVCPGFIDIHNHGAKDVNFLDFRNNEIDEATMYNAAGGTTSFLLTTGPLPINEGIDNLKRIKKALNKKYKGSRVLGIHMEGPYLNQNYGAQRKDYSLIPKRKEYESMVEEAMPYLKSMTVAPELGGARDLIRYLNDKNVITSIGHTEASFEDVDYAISNGAKSVTHIFNAMAQPIQKDKGVKPVGIEEYLMMRDELMAEVMADRHGAHVNPVFLKILVAVKGKDKMMLVTDSIFTAGLKTGTYLASDGRNFTIIEGDINRLQENNDLAGSVMQMKNAVKNMMNHTGLRLKDAVGMATINPARLLNVDNRKGSLRVGMDADIIVIDTDVNVYLTIVEGEIFFRNL
jgi:N-acetylglucosamine-6-phosphate deacetylase